MESRFSIVHLKLKMLPPFEALLVLSLLLASKAQLNLHETSHFLIATVAENIMLPCSNKDNAELGAMRHWYKQHLGTKPVRISSFSKYYKIKTMHGNFNKSHRFTLETQHESNTLVIKDVQMSDSAIYLCVSCFLHDLDVLESVTVFVKSLNPTVKVRQSPHKEIEPGRSAVLNCSVHKENCEGQHRVHWFKQSEESAAGVLYSHEGSSEQCENTTDSPTNSCVYNLPIHNVSSEQTGTYYCAVAACGQVLFGNGTRVNIKDGVDKIIYIMGGALVFTSVLLLSLALSLCRMKKNYISLSTKFKCPSRTCTTCTTNARAQGQNMDSLHYAALSIQPLSRSQRVTVQSDCVYSSVQQD